MKRQALSQALNEVSDKHISEALAKKKRRPLWLGAAAAAVALVILVLTVFQPFSISAQAVSLASEPRILPWPDYNKYKDVEAWRADLDRMTAQRDVRSSTTAQALEALSGFFSAGSAQFLTGSQENLLWSPANAYIGLAMLAELTGGNSREQILNLLNCSDTELLRSHVSALWESVYAGDKHEASALANSLWLEKGLNYRQDTMDALAYHYYASVYKGDLGSSAIDSAISSWLNENTGGLLKSAADNIQLPEDAILALYSTLYFQAKWTEEFKPSNNTTDLFHAPGCDRDVTYMNKKLAMMHYYWGDTYGAVSLSLKNGSQMWFILPDEGLTPEDVLQDGQYMQMLLQHQVPDEQKNAKFMLVNLSVPKFDVSGSQNLKDGLQALGVTDVFSLKTADFSAITSDVPVYITAANQAVRVQVDEQGVKAAAYFELPGATSPMPPDEIIDFVLDRPFLFVLTNDRVPMIAGVVNDPA